jgi:alkanesulfonate monooxygenase SsuD/methylene tetrahydromethanopterin reductase-like flavin-dependent oxidoreductase (luciferase family)
VKFSIVLYMERHSPDQDMREVRNNLMELVRMADQGGFEVIWTGEHHSLEFTISPNPLLTLANWANVVQNARLGTAVISAPYWHPIRLAGEAAMVDLLTDGRLELGIARGAYQREFDRMLGKGIDQREGVAYLKEMIPALKELWKGDYAHDGKYWSFPAATSVPKPLQRPHPPLWVAARDEGTFDYAFENGCNIMSTPLNSPVEEVQNLSRKFREACERHPDVPTPRFMMLRRTCVYDRPEQASMPVEASVAYSRAFATLFRNAGGVTNGFAELAPMEAIQDRADLTPDALQQNLMFGTPEEVVEKLKVYEAAGVDLFCFGADGATFGMPFEFTRRSLELFIERVMPHFK